MAEPQVNWDVIDLKDLLPDFIKDIQQNGVLDVIEVFAQAQVAANTGRALLTDINAEISLQKLHVAAAQAALALIQTSVIGFFNTGVHLLLIEPVIGGLPVFSSTIRNAMLNLRDPRRPAFSETATMFMFGGFGFSPELEEVQAMYRSIANIIASKQTIRAQMSTNAVDQINKTESRFEGLVSSYYTNQVAGLARPVYDSPWISLKLSDFIPGADQILLSLVSLLQAMINTAVPNNLNVFLAFMDKQSSMLARIISEIKQIIGFLEALMLGLPLNFFFVKPDTMGTTTLANAVTSDFFDPIRHPEISNVVGPQIMTGFVLVEGTETDHISLQVKYDTLKTLFGKG